MTCCQAGVWRHARFLVLSMGAILFSVMSVEASIVPRLPKVVLSSSDDYPDVVFVVFAIKTFDPWTTRTHVDPNTAKLIAANMEVDAEQEWPQSNQFAMLAVPRALAENRRTPDPAWLEPSAPGVIRIHGAFEPGWVVRNVVLRYELEKSDKGPKLTLLNPDDLKAAQNQPAQVQLAAPSGPVRNSVLSGLTLAHAAIGVLLLIGGIVVGLLLAFWTLPKT